MFSLWGCAGGQGFPLLVGVSLGVGSDSFFLCLDDGGCIQFNWGWLCLGIHRDELHLSYNREDHRDVR